jgi:hypothetical protein
MIPNRLYIFGFGFHFSFLPSESFSLTAEVLEHELRTIEARFLVSLSTLRRAKDSDQAGALVAALLAKLLPASVRRRR